MMQNNISLVSNAIHKRSSAGIFLCFDLFSFYDMAFADKWAAIVWVCRNQLGRRNVTDEQKTVLIGEAYKAQKMSVGNHAERGSDGRYLSAQNEHKGNNRTSDVIARDFGVGKETVKRAEHFLDGLNEANKSGKWPK